MSRSRNRCRAACEGLEKRRHLSASHAIGCNCTGCIGSTADLEPVPSLEEFDGTEIIANAIAVLQQGPSPVPEDNQIMLSSVVGGTAATGRQPTGALTGKIVFAAAGHGFTAYSGGWHTQRGIDYNLVEDLGNQDQMTLFVNHAFNAGATVVPMRPVGYQPIEVLLDNDDPQVTYTGTWSNSTSSIFYGSAGDVPYRYASVNANETATAKYTPNIPVEGFYPVYTWVKDDSDRINQLYRVAHAGGVSEVLVDHRRIGKGYVYLGTYYFNAGSGGYVEISNKGNNTGSKIVVADHIRFGNGMGDIDRGLGVSQQTRSDEASLYWIEHQKGQGVPMSVIRSASVTSDQSANVSAPPRWGVHMNRDAAGARTERIFLSFHTNGSTGAGRGTIALLNGNNDPDTKTPLQREWAQLVGDEVYFDMHALDDTEFEYLWGIKNNRVYDRGDIEYGEINNLTIKGEFDATILEVGYHDNEFDAPLLLDPRVRNYAARGSVQAMIKYFRTYNNQPDLALPPDAPTNVRSLVQSNGDVTLGWNVPVVDGIGGDAATGYVVYRSSDGFSFGDPVLISGGNTLSYTIPAEQLTGGVNYFRVAATNAGGESMPTEVVANIRGSAGSSPILIVQGFDRLQRQQNPVHRTPLSYDPPFTPNTGSRVHRVRPRFSNSFDYVIRAGESLAAFGNGIGFDTASNEAVIAGQVNLNSYGAVIWLSGEESTFNKTFDATEQTLVTNYLNGGGKLFVSGAEIGYDLKDQGNGAGFYNNQLKADFVTDSAGTYTAVGAAGSIFAGISLTFDNGNSGTYNVDTPDVITAFGGSTIAMNYTGASTDGAAVAHHNAASGSRIVYLAFPFESITTSAGRNAVMSAALDYFDLNTNSLAGTVFNDFNGNGAFDGSDTPAVGHAVYLDFNNNGVLDGAEPSAVTGAEGTYRISDVAPGTYTLRMATTVDGINYAASHPAADTYSVVINSTAQTGFNFGRVPTSFVGGSGSDHYYVRLDASGNKLEISFAAAALNPPTWSVDKTKVTQLNIDGGAGDDSVTIDHFNGRVPHVASAGGSGGESASGDLLRMIGSPQDDQFAMAFATVAATIGGGSSNASIGGFERVQIEAGAGNDTFNYAYSGPAAFTFLGGANTAGDTLNVNNGTFTLNGNAGFSSPNLIVSVGSLGNLVMNTSQAFKSLTVNGTATLAAGGSKLLRTGSLSVPGTFDINDGRVFVNYDGDSPAAALFERIASGRNGGAWNGSGIRSTAAGGSGLYGLGMAEASDVLGLSGEQTKLWSGIAADATTLLIRYTYAGDFDLNGRIDADDYFRIGANYSKATTAYGAGNLDYSSAIDGDDYFWLDANFLAQGPPL